ncbi:MAG: hypothetical protein B0D92_01850 [Spirochaeta sp. LUC14_002_19_P3]|nr:MAG: hypothetical protein B0D92_01850 [Spirochaeta sp. LUC14_002_19_P3]
MNKKKHGISLLKLVMLLLAVLFLAINYLDSLKPLRELVESETLLFNLGSYKVSIYNVANSFIGILVVFWLTTFTVRFSGRRIKKLSDVSLSTKTLITKLVQIGIYSLAVLLGLKLLGIDITTLAIFGGALGIGIGFGLQKITSNLISGIILLLEKSVEVGDLIELSDGTIGFVRNTGSRCMLVEAFDGREIMIPNEDFIANRVTNWTFSSSKGRVEINLCISYNSSVDKAMELMKQCAREHPRSIEEPEPLCFVSECGEYFIKLLLVFWVGDVAQGRMEPKSDVFRAILKNFKENDIEIPYPQRDVYVRER